MLLNFQSATIPSDGLTEQEYERAITNWVRTLSQMNEANTHKFPLVTLEFCKTGIPWGSKREDRKTYQPFEMKAIVLGKRGDTIDICTFIPIMLSNGNGLTVQECFYNISSNGDVRYYYILNYAPLHQRRQKTIDILEAIPNCIMRNETPGAQSWSSNVPKCAFLYYKETREAALTFMLCAKKIPRFNKDVTQLIAKKIYGMHRVWKS